MTTHTARTADRQASQKEQLMSLTYYVALPFVRSDDGTAPGQAMECQSEGHALSRAGAMSRDPANASAIAFKRSGDPLLGDFSDAIVIKRFGEVPERLDEL
jgi:hypothetical protein